MDNHQTLCLTIHRNALTLKKLRNAQKVLKAHGIQF
jgi:hypothetical protein